MATTALHRSGVSHPLGKFTAEFPKFKGPETTHELATQRAARAGMSLAEWQRLVIMIEIHGREEVESVYKTQLDIALGKGNEGGGS